MKHAIPQGLEMTDTKVEIPNIPWNFTYSPPVHVNACSPCVFEQLMIFKYNLHKHPGN